MTYSVRFTLASLRVFDSMLILLLADLCEGHCQVGSLVGEAHLLNDNAGAPRRVQREQNLMWAKRGKARLILIFSTHLQRKIKLDSRLHD